MFGENNNYEKWCEEWRKKFLKLNQEELKKKLPELEEEGDWLLIRHFGRKLGVHKEDGTIEALEDQEPLTCYERLNVYTLFGYVSPLAHYKNEWVKFEKLKDTVPFAGLSRKGSSNHFLECLPDIRKSWQRHARSWAEPGFPGQTQATS